MSTPAMAALAEADPSTRIEAPVREAARYIDAGETEAALALLAPHLSDEAPCLPARFVLAMAAWRMGRLDWAIDLLRFCHERWPMDRDVAEALASLYAQSGNMVESLYMGKLGTALGEAGALAEFVPNGFPSFEIALVTIRERPLLEEAKIALAAGRLDIAVDKARQHVSLRDDDADGAAFAAAAMLRAGAPAEAVALLYPFEAQAECVPALASLYARCLAATGDVADGRRWHEHAIALAPDDASVTAARAADAIWLERDPTRAAAAWLRRFCPRGKARRRQPKGAKLGIVYLVSALGDPHDAAAVAAVARAHDRARCRVIGYGAGAQSWAENASFGGAFDEWRDIAALDAATIARALERDAADLVVDVSGLYAPQSLRALAALDHAVCVGWIGNGTAPAPGLLDAIVEDYPLGHATPRAARAGMTIQFGADAALCQLDPDTVALWAGALKAVPDARLVLRAADTGRGTVDRLIDRFGRDLAARIDLVATESAEAFYALTDIALAPRRGVSARAASEAIARGVPCIALGSGADAGPYAAFLRHIGLGPNFVAADPAGYAAIAAELAGSSDARERAGASARTVAERPEHGAGPFAQRLEEIAARVLRERAPA